MATILLIEDNHHLRKVLACALNSVGHLVLETTNARAALEVQTRIVVDLVITDLVMPECDGLEVIMRMHDSSSLVPVLALSGDSRCAHTMLRAANSLGACQALEKPFTIEEFLATVMNLLPAGPNPVPKRGG